VAKAVVFVGGEKLITALTSSNLGKAQPSEYVEDVKSASRVMFLLAFGIAYTALAQNNTSPRTPGGDAVMVSLSAPKYPPLARQANITGDVEIKLEIRKDGSIQSAIVVSGHPMLTEAALSSAQQSRFECRECEDEATLYSLTYIYSFQLAESPGWPCPETGGIRVTQSENRVTVSADPPMVHLYFSNFKVRSAKCFYLWTCGSRWGGQDYYYYRVRSAKCLGLWNCGYHLREPLATCSKLHREIVN
jgi:TonB family protein